MDIALIFNGKILFKQSGILRSTIWSQRKQRLSGGTQTLNAAVHTQMMMNAQVAQIWQLSRKTPKKSQKSFWPIVNWSCVRYQRSWRYKKAVYSPFWTFVIEEAVFKVGAMFALSLSKTTKRRRFRAFFETVSTQPKGVFWVNIWQLMKHGSTTSLWSQTDNHLCRQQQVKAVQSDQRWNIHQ